MGSRSDGGGGTDTTGDLPVRSSAAARARDQAPDNARCRAPSSMVMTAAPRLPVASRYRPFTSAAPETEALVEISIPSQIGTGLTVAHAPWRQSS